MTLFLNDLRASSVRLVTPWNGAWSADVDVDLGSRTELPTGPSVLTIGTSVLVGTVDPEQSGRFGQRARARLVAGGGAWEKTVGARHYHNDLGVLSTAVLATTAAEIGERVVETTPSRFGVDFVRLEGPASRVLAGLPWYVDATGTTVVGPRIPRPAGPDVKVLSWDARTHVATVASDAVLTPGTILADERFGTAKIRDVEQIWDDSGARATAWTMPVSVASVLTPGGQLVASVAAIAREASGSPFLRTIRYRVVAQGPDGRFILQPVAKTAAPDLKGIDLAPAIPGMSVKVPPGTVAHVVFLEGDRSQPVVVRFEEGTPLEVKIDSVLVQLGTGALPTAGPVAMAAPIAQAFAAVVAYAQAVAAAPTTAATAPASSALAAALAPLTPLMSSTKVLAE